GGGGGDDSGSAGQRGDVPGLREAGADPLSSRRGGERAGAGLRQRPLVLPGGPADPPGSRLPLHRPALVSRPGGAAGPRGPDGLPPPLSATPARRASEVWPVRFPRPGAGEGWKASGAARSESRAGGALARISIHGGAGSTIGPVLLQ